MNNWPTKVEARCGIHHVTGEQKWCSNPATYIVRPNCACHWELVACGKHLARVVDVAAVREDAHMSKAQLIVIAVKPFRTKEAP